MMPPRRGLSAVSGDSGMNVIGSMFPVTSVMVQRIAPSHHRIESPASFMLNLMLGLSTLPVMLTRLNQQSRTWIFKIVQVVGFALLYAWTLWNQSGLESSLVLLPPETDEPVDAPPILLNETFVDVKLNEPHSEVKGKDISSSHPNGRGGGSSVLW